MQVCIGCLLAGHEIDAQHSHFKPMIMQRIRKQKNSQWATLLGMQRHYDFFAHCISPLMQQL